MSLVSARRTVVPKPVRAGIASLKWRERPDIGTNSRGYCAPHYGRAEQKNIRDSQPPVKRLYGRTEGVPTLARTEAEEEERKKRGGGLEHIVDPSVSRRLRHMQ